MQTNINKIDFKFRFIIKISYFSFCKHSILIKVTIILVMSMFSHTEHMLGCI